MFGGLNRPLTAAAVVAAVLLVPPAALASGCGGKPSAVQVYRECLQTGGGGKASGSNSGKSGTQSGTSSQPVPVSKQTKVALKKAGHDGTSLGNLVRIYGARRLLQSHSSAAAAEPTAVGSAFDLGSGPTMLLIILAGTAVVLLAAAGTRSRRRSHHT